MKPSDDDHEILAHQKAKAYDDLFTSPSGMVVLRDLMSRSRVFSSTFDPNPQVAAFNEGFRSAVIYILEQSRLARSDPSFYIQQSLGSRNQHGG